MILQALVQLYEDLLQLGEISPPGWGPAKISYVLCINQNGALTQVLPQYVEVVSGTKTVLIPQSIRLPASVTRSSGILPNFLWDNGSYLLGVGKEGAPGRCITCFRESAQLHHQILDSVDSPAAKAILAYFDTWNLETACSNSLLAGCQTEIRNGANLTFYVDGQYAHNDPLIREAWDRHYRNVQEEMQQCLVTGALDVAEAVHPLLKGVAGTQSGGAAIVSFNAPAFCSYGKKQGLNAPIGKYAAFAYTAALNHLLADRENVHRIGDTTVVCWAEGAEPAYNYFTKFWLFGDPAPERITTDQLRASVNRLAQGLPCETYPLDPNRRFYILGLAPNAARLSVRFFYNSSFGELLRHVSEHYARLQIDGRSHDVMPLWMLLRETINKNTRDSSPNPVMAGAIARAITTGSPYPISLIEAFHLRIRAEHAITPERAAIIKAYYLNNPNPLCPKEVLSVALNETSTNLPYTLGRLFAVYEVVQEAANPGINTTIKDKYFHSAAAVPAVIFPILDNLCQKHLRKLDIGLRIYFDRQITQIKNLQGETNPARLNLPEQGSFHLGYYHQKQRRYAKQEEE